MYDRLRSWAEDRANESRIPISRKQKNLENQQGCAPNRRASAKTRQQEFAHDEFYLKEKKGAHQDCDGIDAGLQTHRWRCDWLLDENRKPLRTVNGAR